MESFFHTLETELVHHAAYPTREAAKRGLFAYIEGYHNRQRIHSALGYIIPNRQSFRPHKRVSTSSGDDHFKALRRR